MPSPKCSDCAEKDFEIDKLERRVRALEVQLAEKGERVEHLQDIIGDIQNRAGDA